ncbi:MAG: trypsin-like peptidase domain-containing protein [Acholeplasmataceae bacterium]|nr:trypsin-like peptidase domain-containing protein [Acholeplasmataceae bacterium]
MKKILITISLFVISMTLTGCDLTIPTQSREQPKIESVVFLEEKDNKQEYLIYFSDGTTQTIFISNQTNIQSNDITVEDLYNTAVENGFSGTILEFIDAYMDVTITNDSTKAIQKGLKSSLSIRAVFKRVETTNPIFGFPKENIVEYGSAGSGIIYKLDKASGTAYIITNHHVVYDSKSNTTNKISDEIYVSLYGLEQEDNLIRATYIGGSETYDIAVLKVTNSEILKNSMAEKVEYVNSDTLQAGDIAIAIGNPENHGISATQGIISLESEYIEMPNSTNTDVITYRVLRVDTAINSGNSGGGLFDSEGRVIGIVNAKMVDESIESIGYAIPSNIVFNVADNIIYHSDNKPNEKVKKAFLGIMMRVKDTVVSYNELTDQIEIKETIEIQSINAGSLASNHFEVADQFISITLNEITYPLDRLYQVSDLLLKVRSNDTVTFTVLRDNEILDLNVTFLETNFNTVD